MKLLIMQSITANADDPFTKYLALSTKVHRDYAQACDAAYGCYVGTYEDLHPSWNRIPMFLDAFTKANYDVVVWLDADTLVVNQEVNIFEEEVSDVALHLLVEKGTRDKYGGWQQDVMNCGVIVARNTPAAIEAFTYVWERRHAPPLVHHVGFFHEQNWITDWCHAHPTTWAPLDMRFNWMPWEGGGVPPEREAVIKAWHGWPEPHRWNGFQQAYTEHYLRP